MRVIVLVAVTVLAVLSLALFLFFAQRGGEHQVKVNATVYVEPNVTLSFKDLRGVNCGPLSPRGWNTRTTLNLTDYYLQLGLSVIRFHDLHGVDELDVIFPDPDADPNDPASYNFTGLDRHVETALKVADKLIIRIGYDWHDPPKNWPRMSFGKVAEVAAHIVAHYTMGWAGGYRFHNILWEVWNEPDIDRFWNGSAEQYFKLYGEVAFAIKRVNPDAKVGGPTIAYNLEFLDRFLNYTRTRNIPLDFVSWHVYGHDPRIIVERAKRVKEIMDRHGYADIPSVLDEWNYWWDNEPWDTFRGPMVASFQAASLIAMEDAPVDLAVLYRGDAWNWGGMFYSDGRPGKPFYAWLAYGRLVEKAVRVYSRVEGANVWALSGRRVDGSLLILLSNPSDEPVECVIKAPMGYTVAEVLVVDGEHDLEAAPYCNGLNCFLPSYSVELVILRRQ